MRTDTRGSELRSGRSTRWSTNGPLAERVVGGVAVIATAITLGIGACELCPEAIEAVGAIGQARRT